MGRLLTFSEGWLPITIPPTAKDNNRPKAVVCFARC